MQNYNAPQSGPGSLGGQPPAKKGLSKGCIIGIIAAAVVGVGLVVIAIAGIAGVYWFKQRSRDIATFDPSSTSSSNSSTSSTGSDDAEGPQPTSAQREAISGGQTASWEEQEITWTVPQKWKEYSSDSSSLHWRSPGSWDAANLLVNISPMSADFPSDVSLAAFYDQAKTRKQNGEVDEYRYLNLGGIKGVLFRESSPEDEDGPQRLQWLGYRDYKGQKQMVNIMLSTRGKDFARHEDALYGVLYSTDF